MSARNRLLAYLRQVGLSTPRAEANLDAFAHELAEQIRRHDFDANLVGTRCGCSDGLTDDAADLIDPYATVTPVRSAGSEETT